MAKSPPFLQPIVPPGTRFLLSFDIDGTLEIGDPPGPIQVAVLREAMRLGHVVGSSSDRTLTEQRALWEQAGLAVDFVNRKHELALIRRQFTCIRFIHVGDSTADRTCAVKAQFEFFPPDAIRGERLSWLADKATTGTIGAGELA